MDLVDVTARASEPKGRNHSHCGICRRDEARWSRGRKRKKVVSVNCCQPPEPSESAKKLKNRFRIDADSRDSVAFSGQPIYNNYLNIDSGHISPPSSPSLCISCRAGFPTEGGSSSSRQGGSSISSRTAARVSLPSYSTSYTCRASLNISRPC